MPYTNNSSKTFITSRTFVSTNSGNYSLTNSNGEVYYARSSAHISNKSMYDTSTQYTPYY